MDPAVRLSSGTSGYDHRRMMFFDAIAYSAKELMRIPYSPRAESKTRAASRVPISSCTTEREFRFSVCQISPVHSTEKRVTFSSSGWASDLVAPFKFAIDKVRDGLVIKVVPKLDQNLRCAYGNTRSTHDRKEAETRAVKFLSKGHSRGYRHACTCEIKEWNEEKRGRQARINILVAVFCSLLE